VRVHLWTILTSARRYIITANTIDASFKPKYPANNGQPVTPLTTLVITFATAALFQATPHQTADAGGSHHVGGEYAVYVMKKARFRLV
jgi:hypothetical protein